MAYKHQEIKLRHKRLKLNYEEFQDLTQDISAGWPNLGESERKACNKKGEEKCIYGFECDN